MFYVDYGELSGIIEGYVADASLTACLIIESGSLLAISRLSSHDDDFSKLGALSFHFLDSIDSLYTVFSHVYRSRDNPTHVLVRNDILSSVSQE